MTRIRPIDATTATGSAAEVLSAVRKKLRSVPNLIATMAHSPAVANAYLGFSQTLATGTLRPRLREQIALVVAEANQCGYCIAAHTALGKAAGLTEEETRAARRADSAVEKERVALDFAYQLVQERGIVADADFERVRQAGYTDGEIAEIVANVALNLFTNYFNHVAGTEVDFPAAPELAAA